MTLEEAEADPRFEQFKFCSFLDLVAYINKCEIFMSTHPDDKEVDEMRTAAKLIRDRRIGKNAK